MEMRLLVFALILPMGSNQLQNSFAEQYQRPQKLNKSKSQQADVHSTTNLAHVLLASRPGVFWRRSTPLQTQVVTTPSSANTRWLTSAIMKLHSEEASSDAYATEKISNAGRRMILAPALVLPLLLARPAKAVEAKNPVIAALSRLLPSDDGDRREELAKEDPLDMINWNGAKSSGLSTKQMADLIDAGLREREWFVTGRGLPELFSERFVFSDPDVSLEGFEPYCRQVRRLFDQQTARCEVVCCAATAANTITILWRNSGKINLGPGFELKPYLVTTTLLTDPTDGLIVSQKDTFEINQADFLLYQVPALRPFLTPSSSAVEMRQQYDSRTCTLIA